MLTQLPRPSILVEIGIGLLGFRKSIPALSPKHQMLLRFWLYEEIEKSISRKTKGAFMYQSYETEWDSFSTICFPQLPIHLITLLNYPIYLNYPNPSFTQFPQSLNYLITQLP